MSINLVIACDAIKAPLTGIGYYAGHLLTELLKSPDIDDLAGLRGGALLEREALQALITCAVAGGGQGGVGWRYLPGWGRHLLSPLSPLLRQRRLRRNTGILASKPGWLLHAPDFIAPPHAGPTVITVHDLSHIRYPEAHPRDRVTWLNGQLPGAIARAARVICVSEFTRNELLALGLVADPGKLAVCHNGCDAGFHPRPDDDIAAIVGRWRLRAGNYILSVATLEPRKNLERLLDAYEQLPGDLAAAFPLVLTGAPGWNSGALAGRIARSKGNIVVTGYLDRHSLHALMSGAGLFAYMSLYEGFGLPVVEAMASGTPVICSDNGALAEVAGDCGYTVDPLDTGAIRDGMAAMLEDSSLRRHYRQAGLDRARGFSWQRCAEQTIAVYKSVIDEAKTST